MSQPHPLPDSPAERCKALAELGHVAAADAGSRATLFAALADPLWQVRDTALRALAPALPGDRTLTVRLLELAVHDPSVWLRATATELLAERPLDEALHTQLAAVVDDPTLGDEVRIRALRLAGAQPELLVRALRAEAWAVRAAAVQLCATYHVDAAFDALQSLARSDGDGVVRARAIDALGALGAARVRELLVEQAQPEQPPAVRRSAAAALGHLLPDDADDAVYAALTEALADADAELRLAAARSLGQLGVSTERLDVALALRARLADSSDAVSIAALEALTCAILRDRDLLTAVQRQLNGVAPQVRSGVVRLLLRLSLEAPAPELREPLLTLAVDDRDSNVRDIAAKVLIRSEPMELLIDAVTEQMSAAVLASKRSRVLEFLGRCFAVAVPRLPPQLMEQFAAALADSVAELRMTATRTACCEPSRGIDPRSAAERSIAHHLVPLIVRRAFEGELATARLARDGLRSRFASAVPTAFADALVTTPRAPIPLEPAALLELGLDTPLSAPADDCLCALHTSLPARATRAALPGWRGHANWWSAIAQRRRPELASDIAALEQRLATEPNPIRIARGAAIIAALASPPPKPDHQQFSEVVARRVARALSREHAWQMARLLAAAAGA